MKTTEKPLNDEPVYEKEVSTTLENYWWSLHRNVLINVRLYFVVFILTFLYGVNIVGNLGERVSGIEKEIRKNKSSVIALSNDGRVIGVSKTALKYDNYSTIIATIVEDYLVQSRHTLLDYSNKLKIDNSTDLYQSQNPDDEDRNLRSFYKFYIDKTTDVNGIQEGKDSFGKYMTKLVIFLRKNEIPTSVDTVGYTYDKSADWSVRGNRFRLKVKINALTSGVTDGGKKYSNRKTYGTYEVEGYIDIDKRDDSINPFGIQFYSIEALPPKNATDLEVQKLEIGLRNNNAQY